eukprot:jgi/Ulvmu1/2785/UM140_0015.1
MPETRVSMDALTAVRQKLEKSDEFWRIRSQAKEHLARVRDLEEDNVKDAIKSFLHTSGNALKLQNLAYALKHGLVLPFDAAPGHTTSLPEQDDGKASPHHNSTVSSVSASTLQVAEREASCSDWGPPSQQSSAANCSVDLQRRISLPSAQPDYMHDSHPPAGDQPWTAGPLKRDIHFKHQSAGAVRHSGAERLSTETHYTAAPPRPAHTFAHSSDPPSPGPASPEQPPLQPCGAADPPVPSTGPTGPLTAGHDPPPERCSAEKADETCPSESPCGEHSYDAAHAVPAEPLGSAHRQASGAYASLEHTSPDLAPLLQHWPAMTSAAAPATAPAGQASAPTPAPAGGHTYGSHALQMPAEPGQPPPVQEPQAMQALRDHWQAVVVDRLMRLATAAGEPLAQRALAPAQLEERRAANPGPASERIGQAETASMAAKPPLDMAVIPTALLQRGVAAALAGSQEVPGCEPAEGADLLRLPPPSVGVPMLPVCPDIAGRVPTLAWLREHFRDLHPRHRQVGVDDRGLAAFARRAVTDARAIIAGGRVPAALLALRRGVPQSCRAALWSSALCVVPDDPKAVEHFEALCERVEERRLLVDSATVAAVGALTDADDFFLFAEPLRAAALAFSRDPSTAALAAAPPHPRLVGLGRGGHRHGLYPPGGVLPHTGAVALSAPLAYLFPTAAGIMLCHRALYCRHWCKLTSMSAQGAPAPCMPVLAATFAALLEAAEPGLEARLAGVCAFSARDCAIEWMACGFVGVLDVEEVLLLWDRVIGFDSLLVLPAAAAALFAWRGCMLRECTCAGEATAALQHLSQVQIIPILQGLLFLTGGRKAEDDE